MKYKRLQGKGWKFHLKVCINPFAFLGKWHIPRGSLEWMQKSRNRSFCFNTFKRSVQGLAGCFPLLQTVQSTQGCAVSLVTGNYIARTLLWKKSFALLESISWKEQYLLLVYPTPSSNFLSLEFLLKTQPPPVPANERLSILFGHRGKHIILKHKL